MAVAIAAIVWLGLGLRASRLEDRGLALASAPGGLRDAGAIARARDPLVRARANNADTRPLVLQGELYIFAGRPRQALGPLLEVVRREPRNYDAWRLVTQAALSSGYASLAARGRAREAALSPPVR